MSTSSNNLAERIPEFTTYTAGASSVAFWGLSVGDIATLTASIVAVLSFCVHLWSVLRRDRREQARFERDMQMAEDDPEEDETSSEDEHS